MAAPEAENVWLRLPFSPESAGEARRRFDSWLSDHAPTPWPRDDWRDDVQLVLSELVGNSVRHANPLPGDAVEVGWAHGDEGLDIAVRDGGAAQLPEVRDADPLGVSGRGLTVVEALAARWWVDRTDQRTTTHALLI